MLINLKTFQIRAVDELFDSSSRMLQRANRQNVIALQAPTGAGKTIMAASLIERLASETQEELCFIWVTIGKGDLQVQSRNALLRFFNGNPTVNLIEEQFNGGRTAIHRNEVIVVNWEKIRSKVRGTGEYANVLMRDGEVINFREVLANTREMRKIVLIVDESHVGATAERTQELKNEFDAHILLEISATPKLVPSAEAIKAGTGDFVKVAPVDVIAAGLIKKDIIINQGIDSLASAEVDSQIAILESAHRKRIALADAYEALGVNVNPLVLVQIPNAEAGDQKLAAIQDFLAEKGITESNGRLAVWLSDYPHSENLGGISLNDNPVEFLVFKQALDTGWDCPRAQVLVKFRETKSETFEIQVLGRILRMPEAMHYHDDSLNCAYVFTNISEIRVAREDYNPNIIKHLKMTRSDSYKNIELPSYYKSRADYGDITGDFTEIFDDVASRYFEFTAGDFEHNLSKMRAKGLNPGLAALSDVVIANVVIEAGAFDNLGGEVEGENQAELSKSATDTQLEFNAFLRENMGTFTNVARSVPAMKSALFSFFRRHLGKFGNQDLFWLQKMVLGPENVNHFKHALGIAVNQFAVHREQEVMDRVEGGEQNTIFEVPQEIYINEFLEEIYNADRSIMSPCYLEVVRSKVEKQFEARIDKDPNVLWWFKNGINKIEYLGIKYFFPANLIKTFYPDYVVQYNDGTLAVYETKSKGDDANFGGFNEKTKQKAEALYAWKTALANEGRNVRAGVVVVVNETHMIVNENSVYDHVKAHSGDLSDWTVF